MNPTARDPVSIASAHLNATMERNRAKPHARITSDSEGDLDLLKSQPNALLKRG